MDDYMGYKHHQIRVRDNGDGTYTAYYADMCDDPNTGVRYLIEAEIATAPGTRANVIAAAKAAIDAEVY